MKGQQIIGWKQVNSLKIERDKYFYPWEYGFENWVGSPYGNRTNFATRFPPRISRKIPTKTNRQYLAHLEWYLSPTNSNQFFYCCVETVLQRTFVAALKHWILLKHAWQTLESFLKTLLGAYLAATWSILGAWSNITNLQPSYPPLTFLLLLKKWHKRTELVTSHSSSCCRS